MSDARRFEGRLVTALSPSMDPSVRGAALDALQSSAFVPTHWGFYEVIRTPYERSELDDLGEANKDDIGIVRRRRTPAYQCHLSEDSVLFFSKAGRKHVADLFALCDGLADAVQPSLGSVHLGFDWPDVWTSQRDVQIELMNRAGFAARISVKSAGILGLAMRTYISGVVLEQLGEQRVATLPAEVTRTSWGGYRIDLAPEPWERSVEELMPIWEACTHHLMPCGHIAEPILDHSDSSVTRRPGPKGGLTLP